MTNYILYLRTSPDLLTLQAILMKLRNDNVDEHSHRRSFINVRRKHVWEDASRHLLRKKFDPKAIISVKFADDDGNSEGAIDAGGPRREFLRLLIKAANEHAGLFYGKLDQRVLFPNAIGMRNYEKDWTEKRTKKILKISNIMFSIYAIAARAKGHYKVVGTIICWSLVHGGPGGNIFSKTLFDAIAFGIGTKDAEINDIHDNEVLEKINKVLTTFSLYIIGLFLSYDYAVAWKLKYLMTYKKILGDTIIK